MRRRLKIVLPAVVSMLLVASSAFAFGDFGDWGDAEDIETHGAGADDDLNTRATEGCPFISPDGKMLFFASNRGGLSGLDIWVTTRRSENDPWGEPVKLGAPINSPENDFCPTISRDGKTFFFVSTRDGHCGSTRNADIYTARFDSRLEVDSVTHLGCEVNSPGTSTAHSRRRCPERGRCSSIRVPDLPTATTPRATTTSTSHRCAAAPIGRDMPCPASTRLTTRASPTCDAMVGSCSSGAIVRKERTSTRRRACRSPGSGDHLRTSVRR